MVFEDKFSELPDEVLSFILSQLSLREMVSSSILSSRWRYIWKTSAKYSHKINLDVLSMRGRNYANGMFHDFICNDAYRRSTEYLLNFANETPRWFKEDHYVEKRNLLDKERCKFVRWADMMMQLDYNSVIDSFRLEFCLNKDFTHSIDKWISIAIAKGVKNFDIDLSNLVPISDWCSKKLYKFPCHLFTEDAAGLVKRLSLSTCDLANLDFKYFQSLVDLHLEDIDLEDIDLDQDNIISSFLSGCPNIEKLSLIKIRIPSRLDIVGPSLKLKHLKIQDCGVPHIINIDAKSLSKFEYLGARVNFLFYLPQLSDVTFHFVETNFPDGLDYALGQLSTDFPKLESLSLTVARHKDTTIRRRLPLFTNLKELVLKVICPGEVLWGFIPLLQASPCLHSLELHLFQSATKSDPVPWHLALPHHHLKEMKLTGFNGSHHEVEFLRYILGNCKALENMTIDCESKKYDYRQGKFYCSESSPQGRKKKKEATRQKMKTEIAARRAVRNVMRPGLQLRFV
ncbi:hypothetical protein ACHQM5_018561 [Ranunculus cassubicifolius]